MRLTAVHGNAALPPSAASARATQNVAEPSPEPPQKVISAMMERVARLLSQRLTRANMQEAAACCERILHAAADHYDALSILADISYQLGDRVRAKQVFDKLLALAPEAYEPYFGRAALAWDEADWGGAREFFRLGLVRLADDLGPSAVQDHAQFLLGKLALHGLGEDTDEAVWQRSMVYLLKPERTIGETLSFLQRAGLKLYSPLLGRMALFERIVVPLIQTLLHRQDYLSAHRLAEQSFRVATYPHSAENWSQCMAPLCALFGAAGAVERARLPALPVSVARPAMPQVGLLIDESISCGSGLQYIEELLTEFAQTPDRLFTPVVYCLCSTPQSLRELCQRWSIVLVDMDALRLRAFADDELHLRVLDVRTHAQSQGISAFIYFSTMEWLISLVAAIGLAPVQIYTTLMFHSFASPYIDGYLATASLKAGLLDIDGRVWRTIPISAVNRLPPPDMPGASAFEQHAREIRTEILGTRFSTIIAAIARPEKVDDDFMNLVARLLKRHPDTVFVYFGLEAQPPAHILSLIKAYGIEAQCHYAGWVSTLLYSKVVDIHLDPLHMPSGYTMYETFWAGGAYVLKRGETADRIGMTPYLREVADAEDDRDGLQQAKAIFHCPDTGENLLMLASSIAEYEAFAERLVAEPLFRAKVAAAAAQFMQNYFGTPGRVTRAYQHHLLELIAAKQAG